MNTWHSSVSPSCLHILHTCPKTAEVRTGPVAGLGPGLYHSGRLHCRRICRTQGLRFSALVLAEIMGSDATLWRLHCLAWAMVRNLTGKVNKKSSSKTIKHKCTTSGRVGGTLMPEMKQDTRRSTNFSLSICYYVLLPSIREDTGQMTPCSHITLGLLFWGWIFCWFFAAQTNETSVSETISPLLKDCNPAAHVWQWNIDLFPISLVMKRLLSGPDQLHPILFSLLSHC